jgi:hypothetical protein
MGSIAANRLVAEASTLKLDNIVHMASADSVDNTFSLTFNYMRTDAGKETQFYALMLQEENENREARLAGAVPSGSLLTWIDNMFTDPPTSRSRRAGRWSNMSRFVTQIPQDIATRAHFTVFDKKASGQPLNHGDFGYCQFWSKAFWTGTDPNGKFRGQFTQFGLGGSRRTRARPLSSYPLTDARSRAYPEVPGSAASALTGARTNASLAP